MSAQFNFEVHETELAEFLSAFHSGGRTLEPVNENSISIPRDIGRLLRRFSHHKALGADELMRF